MDTNAAAKDDQETVSLNALRGQVIKRLMGVHQRLDEKGVSAVFTRAAKADAVGDMGFLSSMIVNMVLGGPVGDFMEAHLHLGGDNGMSDAFNGAAVVGGLEALSVLRDLEAYRYRGRHLNDYPEGRRKCALFEAGMSKKFNLVSANQNNQLSFDVEAELACMYEILDMLDRLEQRGAKILRTDNTTSVYDILKRAGKPKSGKETIKNSVAMELMAG